MNIGQNFIWHEKYSPKTIEETILPVQVKKDFLKMIEQGEFSHLLFSGSPGIGKTTVAKVLADTLGMDMIFINASTENGIDTIRNKVVDFVSTVSIANKPKLVVLDESDFLSLSAQPALRALIDTYGNNARFILTCNFENKLIEPLVKRCSHYNFEIPKDERNDLMSEMFDRLVVVLNKEEIEFDEKALIQLVKSNFPNFRKTLIDLQRYSLSGKIDVGILGASSDGAIKELVGIIKKKQFEQMRTWVEENQAIDKDRLFADLYRFAKLFLQPASVPQLILILAEYQYKSHFVANQTINTVACILEIMSSCTFKE
jgi:DNA polymerase III delta prime subunit